ncbi:hypothetical protein [Paucibacter sp. Y2R2-4]|uniref:hypothetical protein n=1 Tax=Paucibacter sp. Y2R2-4 TaxID=2893553 RepID=UPI0021E49B87|nr:hypothetical protein [Paucibacter sp. Y2R2-4]MCV2350553.1 hypothetical protein [Paucibacter sp. Y2R2-4]
MNSKAQTSKLRSRSGRLIGAVWTLGLLASLSFAPGAHSEELRAEGSLELSTRDGDKPVKQRFAAGLSVQEQANLQEMGLPLYPGAMAQRDSKDDKPGATVGLSFGPFKFKVLVSKFASTDSLDAIDRFYQAALSPYGQVLNCSAGVKQPAKKEAKTGSDESTRLSCNEVSASVSERVYKAGNDKNFRLVSMKQVGEQVHFQLVRLELRGI